MAEGGQLRKGGHQGGDALGPDRARLPALGGPGRRRALGLNFSPRKTAGSPGQAPWSGSGPAPQALPRVASGSGPPAGALRPPPHPDDGGTREEPRASPAPSSHSQTPWSPPFPVPRPAPPLSSHWLRRQGPAPALPWASAAESTYRPGRPRLIVVLRGFVPSCCPPVPRTSHRAASTP